MKSKIEDLEAFAFQFLRAARVDDGLHFSVNGSRRIVCLIKICMALDSKKDVRNKLSQNELCKIFSKLLEEKIKESK